MALVQCKIKENSANVLRLILPVSMTKTISAYYGIGAVLGERERVSKGEEAMNRENGFPNYTTGSVSSVLWLLGLDAGLDSREWRTVPVISAPRKLRQIAAFERPASVAYQKS